MKGSNRLYVAEVYMAEQTLKTGARAKRRRGPGIAVIVGIAVLALAVVGITMAVWRGKHVRTISVNRGAVVRAFYATGVVRPDYEYILKSKAQGALVQLLVREGQRVKKDQLLARVDDKQLRFEVESEQAEFREAKAQAADNAPLRQETLARLKEAQEQKMIAQRTLERVQSTFDRGVGSIQDLDVARKDLVQWSNTIAAYESKLGSWKYEWAKKLEMAEASVRKAEANLADAEIRAPIDGIVLERFVERDQVVGVNEKIYRIAAVDDKIMKASVDEEDVTRTHLNQRVLMQLYAYPDQVLEGAVFEILPVADPANKTYEVKVRFEKPPETLRVGMTAELNFIEEIRENTLIVPSTAVMENQVWRQTSAGQYEPTPVKLGIKSIDKYEVIEGLNEHDVIVADAKDVAPVKLPAQPKPVVPTRKGDNKEAPGF